MKGKIISVLFCLMVVFGMLFVSCDNGALKEDPYKTDENKVAVDWYNPAGLTPATEYYEDKVGGGPNKDKPDGIPDGVDPQKILGKDNHPKKAIVNPNDFDLDKLRTDRDAAFNLKKYIPWFPFEDPPPEN